MEALIQVGLYAFQFYKEKDQWNLCVLGRVFKITIPGAGEFLDSIINDLKHNNDSQRPPTGLIFDVDVFSEGRGEPFGLFELSMVSHDESGATYRVTGSLAKKYGKEDRIIYLDNFVHTALDDHPTFISLVQCPRIDYDEPYPLAH